MSLLVIVLGSATILLIAYYTYGRLLGRLLRLRADVATPAVALRDDVDYAPIESNFLLSQHFSAIAAAGPIVGPILAGVMFGWVPALIWILVGSIFIGGVHDMTSLVASIRHKARSIAEVVRDHMSKRSYILFLSFVWLALVYIIVAFTDVTSQSFHGAMKLENGESLAGGGGAIATSSLLYLLLPIVMGVLLRYTKLSLNWATIIFLPLVGVAIWAGQFLPFDFETRFNMSPAQAQQTWNIGLLAYCLIASVLPMWLLLQPRGHLGGYFLYIALGAGMIGVLCTGLTGGALDSTTIAYPAFLWGPSAKPLFPFLFITIACGACSGFHSIIASGTTSKQLRSEPDARLVGYGAMLMEAMVAIISLCCVMRLAAGSPLLNGAPNLIYAQGMASFMTTINTALHNIGLPQNYVLSPQFAVTFGLMAFTTFVYDTLDVCTRLGRYILQELTGWSGSVGRWVTTGVTAGVPLAFLLAQPTNGPPLWKVFWDLFGASNQLLAALTLLGVTVWLWRTYRATWVLFVTGLPCVWMYVVSMWALWSILAPLVPATRGWIAGNGFILDKSVNNVAVPVVAALLATLGLLILLEAIRVLLSGMSREPRDPQGLAVPA